MQPAPDGFMVVDDEHLAWLCHVLQNKDGLSQTPMRLSLICVLLMAFKFFDPFG